MNYRIFHGGKPVFNRKDYDTKHYDCVSVFYTNKERPVLLSRHKTENRWKVQYNFSTVIFNSYADAMDFCKARFYDKNGDRLCDRKDV